MIELHKFLRNRQAGIAAAADVRVRPTRPSGRWQRVVDGGAITHGADL